MSSHPHFVLCESPTVPGDASGPGRSTCNLGAGQARPEADPASARATPEIQGRTPVRVYQIPW